MGEKTCMCSRCGRSCRVAGPGNPDAEMMRLSAVPSGHCIDCYVVEFLMNTYPVNMDLDEKGPESLRNPGLQELFGELMRTAKADGDLAEIDWDRVIANWDLPVTIARGNPKNPYLPMHPRRASPEYRYENGRGAWVEPTPTKGPRKRRGGKTDQPGLF